MQITVDLDATVPVFAQLVGQIKAAVQSEALRPGDALPSIRQLAADLDLNMKTVAKAFRLLERDAVIQTKGYRGTFVHPDAKANSQVDLNELVTKELVKTVEALRQAGATDSEIRVAFGEVMSRST
jgi:GntR family transcriptional regulator